LRKKSAREKIHAKNFFQKFAQALDSSPVRALFFPRSLTTPTIKHKNIMAKKPAKKVVKKKPAAKKKAKK